MTGGTTTPGGIGGIICIWALSWFIVGGGGLIAWKGLFTAGGMPNGLPDPGSTIKVNIL